MLLCKDCDYYHAICRKDCEGSAVSFCKFTDILFLKDTDDLEGEYPCRSVSFSDYLKKESACACDGAEVQKYIQW